MVIKGDNKKKFKVERPDRFGGDVEYGSYEDLEKDFVSKKLHPMDLKQGVAREISKIFSKMDRKKLIKLSEKAYKDE